jgi:hypothetical protein
MPIVMMPLQDGQTKKCQWQGRTQPRKSAARCAPSQFRRGVEGRLQRTEGIPKSVRLLTGQKTTKGASQRCTHDVELLLRQQVRSGARRHSHQGERPARPSCTTSTGSTQCRATWELQQFPCDPTEWENSTAPVNPQQEAQANQLGVVLDEGGCITLARLIRQRADSLHIEKRPNAKVQRGRNLPGPT